MSISVWHNAVGKAGKWMCRKRGFINIISPETLAAFEDEFNCKRIDAGEIYDRFVFDTEEAYTWFILKWDID